MPVKVEKGKIDEKGMDMCHLGGKRAQNYPHCSKLTECVARMKVSKETVVLRRWG